MKKAFAREVVQIGGRGFPSQKGGKCNKIVGLHLKVLLYNFVGNKNT